MLEESFVDADGKMSPWVLEPIEPERSLEAKMLKPRLSYFGHEKTKLTGKDSNDRKR